MTPAVLSLGSINSHQPATNILPDKVELAGTFRTLDETWRTQAHVLITELATQLAASMGAECTVNIRKGYPHLDNHAALTAQVRQSTADFLGESNVVDKPPVLAAEDFAYYGQHVPACFYFLGVANAGKGITSGVHTATFNIDERALDIGMTCMAWNALQTLASFKA